MFRQPNVGTVTDQQPISIIIAHPKAEGASEDGTKRGAGRALGLAGGKTDVTAEQASRNLSAIIQTSQALNEGVRKVSDEWFKFARARIERAFEHVDKAMRSRTPQELAAIQTEAVRDNLEGMLQSTRRIAELSQQTANEASRKLSEAMGRAA